MLLPLLVNSFPWPSSKQLLLLPLPQQSKLSLLFVSLEHLLLFATMSIYHLPLYIYICIWWLFKFKTISNCLKHVLSSSPAWCAEASWSCSSHLGTTREQAWKEQLDLRTAAHERWEEPRTWFHQWVQSRALDGHPRWGMPENIAPYCKAILSRDVVMCTWNTFLTIFLETVWYLQCPWAIFPSFLPLKSQVPVPEGSAVQGRSWGEWKGWRG